MKSRVDWANVHLHHSREVTCTVLIAGDANEGKKRVFVAGNNSRNDDKVELPYRTTYADGRDRYELETRNFPRPLLDAIFRDGFSITLETERAGAEKAGPWRATDGG